MNYKELIAEALSMPRGMKSFADETGGKIQKAGFTGDTLVVEWTDKTWDDGAPVTKGFSRGGKKTINPKGEYYVIETNKYWYWTIDGVWYAQKKSGTPPFNV